MTPDISLDEVRALLEAAGLPLDEAAWPALVRLLAEHRAAQQTLEAQEGLDVMGLIPAMLFDPAWD